MTQTFQPNRSATRLARRAAMLALAAGSCIASHAAAQGAAAKSEDELHGSFSQPLKAARRAGPDGHTRVVMNENNNGESFTLTINDDEISVQHNGESVPPDRVERKDNVVIVKDQDGKTLKTFDVGVVGPGARWTVRAVPQGGQGLFRYNVEPQNGLTWVADAQPSSPPPVMVGITMSSPDSSLLEHLGLDEGGAFVIDRVVDDLPASKAGLKPKDLVIEIDGHKPATQDRFREVIRGKKPGETIELTFVRRGKTDHVKVDLVAYDGSKLGQTTVTTVPGSAWPGGGDAGHDGADAARAYTDALGQWREGSNWSGEARRHIEEALKRLKDNPDLQPEKLKAESQRALEEALKAMKGTRDLWWRGWNNWKQGDENGPDIIVGPDQDQVFRIPRGGGGGGPETGRQLDRLGDQLDRLNKRLDELERRLDEREHRSNR